MHLSIPVFEGGRPLPRPFRGAVIALGNFDGFHFGHQAVVKRAVSMARERGVRAIIGTFDPHPVDYFKPGMPPFRLTTLDQRRRLFASAGADAMMVFQFNSALANATPVEFFKKWLTEVGGVVTGANFTFGLARAGNTRILTDLCAEQEIVCATVEPVMLDKEVVSSTRIRSALQAGDCAVATRLLTRPFIVDGVVQSCNDSECWHGIRTTVNLGGYLQPSNGIYAVQVRRANKSPERGLAHLQLSGSANRNKKSLELYIITSEMVSDEAVEIAFINKIR